MILFANCQYCRDIMLINGSLPKDLMRMWVNDLCAGRDNTWIGKIKRTHDISGIGDRTASSRTKPQLMLRISYCLDQSIRRKAIWNIGNCRAIEIKNKSFVLHTLILTDRQKASMIHVAHCTNMRVWCSATRMPKPN